VCHSGEFRKYWGEIDRKVRIFKNKPAAPPWCRLGRHRRGGFAKSGNRSSGKEKKRKVSEGDRPLSGVGDKGCSERLQRVVSARWGKKKKRTQQVNCKLLNHSGKSPGEATNESSRLTVFWVEGECQQEAAMCLKRGDRKRERKCEAEKVAM